MSFRPQTAPTVSGRRAVAHAEAAPSSQGCDARTDAPHDGRYESALRHGIMHVVLASGQKIRVFTLVRPHPQELDLRVQRSFRGEDVASILSEIGEAHAALPDVTQEDNGTQFTSTALDHWPYWNRVQLDFSRPAKPVDNCIVPAFDCPAHRGPAPAARMARGLQYGPPAPESRE
jgi:hypothetical protein